jgi:hypothetical protein
MTCGGLHKATMVGSTKPLDLLHTDCDPCYLFVGQLRSLRQGLSRQLGVLERHLYLRDQLRRLQ